ncbi:serine hydrolase domain-containing protein [Risungbinella massiliensis]|uniref:serine hydrolase domain-containing protein n=1 Tax=Risungbinella massiliensis TaxID=1329796 RepID=UPI0005CC7FEA|nr:serine hydrolase domain-containing protein [Risungbinella massiliensis]
MEPCIQVVVRTEKFKIYRLVIVILITICLVFSPLITYAKSEEVKVDTDKIDHFVESAMDKLQIPGIALGIVKGDQTVYLKGYGISGPDKTPVTPQTPFVLGSTSKSITALAIMQLVEEGKIDLKAPVQRYLPWFRVADEEASKKILVQDLLYQTSGIAKYDGHIGMVNGNKSIEEHIRSLKNIQLTGRVGGDFQYSNLNYDILSGIVQVVSGDPFSKYVQNHIFKPLEMKHSYDSPKEAEKDGLATGYQSIFGWMVPTEQLDHRGTIASGYLISSAEDMSNYLVAQMNGGHFKKNKILSTESVKQMHNPVSPMGDGSSYAMGWSVKNNVIFHVGATENTYSFMVMKDGYGIILLANSMDFLVYYDQIVMGIDEILHGGKPTLANIPDFQNTYLIVDLVALAVLIYITWSIYGLCKKRMKWKATPLRIMFQILSILLFQLLIPLAILFYLPKILIAPWSVIIVFLPGLGHFLFLFAIVLLCIGIVKTAFLIRSNLRGKKKLNVGTFS